jgi:molecular chaperone GrpE
MVKKAIKKQTIDEKDRRIGELIDTLQRLQAEFDNYRKRTEQEIIQFKERAEQNLIKELLLIIDNFELALKSNTEKTDFSKGMELIYAQLLQMLEDKGLQPIIAVNKQFDPYLHEALLTEKSKKEPNTVLEELQKGYMIKDKVLRHSKVKVSKH